MEAANTLPNESFNGSDLIRAMLIRNILKKTYFDIGDIDKLVILDGRARDEYFYNPLFALHCLDYKDMDRELLSSLPTLIGNVTGIDPVEFSMISINDKADSAFSDPFGLNTAPSRYLPTLDRRPKFSDRISKRVIVVAFGFVVLIVVLFLVGLSLGEPRARLGVNEFGGSRVPLMPGILIDRSTLVRQD